MQVLNVISYTEPTTVVFVTRLVQILQSTLILLNCEMTVCIDKFNIVYNSISKGLDPWRATSYIYIVTVVVLNAIQYISFFVFKSFSFFENNMRSDCASSWKKRFQLTASMHVIKLQFSDT